MKALVYHGPGQKSWDEKLKPTIKAPTDAIVKILQTTICGTDLHILKGDVPSVTEGRILGHEGVGVVEAIGSAVTNFKINDRVLISCITACGKCTYCRKQMYSHCETGGWILGNTIDGTQAEYVRIPYADTSLYRIPAHSDEDELVLLSDILPTGFECGVLNGQVKPGDVIAVVGAGPIGLAALITAQLYSPAVIILIDKDDNRLNSAMQLGATHTINSERGQVLQKVMEITKNKGADVVIEAVGTSSTFELCQEIVAAGGHIANIGVHGSAATIHLEKLWSQNITITTQLVNTSSTPMLFDQVLSGKLDVKKLITHRFKLGDILEAYTTFGNAAKEKALKVIMTNE